MAERRIVQESLPPTLIRGMASKPFDDIYHFVLTRTWSQYFLLIAVVFVATNALFALVYWVNPGCVTGAQTFEDDFFFSIEILTQYKTKEGEVMRRPIDLPLVRDRTSIFILTWIPMHRIDADSLFYGENAIENLRNAKAELFLSFTGYDETLAQTVHARWRYAISDIKWDTRFADVLEIMPDGTQVVDYTKFHEIEPVK